MGAIEIIGVSAIVIAVVLAIFFVRRHHQQHGMPMLRAGAMPNMPPQGIIYSDAPTVRVTQRERFNRVNRKIRVQAGGQSDVLDLKQPDCPKLLIALKGIEQNAAHFEISLGGLLAVCGPAVRECERNEFVAPLAAMDDQRSSVFYIREAGGSLTYMRIVVSAIDRDTETAEFDVLLLSGMWYSDKR
jgi:hypothetical protein